VLLLVGGVGEVRNDLLEVAKCLHIEAARQRELPRLPVPEPPLLGKASLGLREASLAPAVTVTVRDAVGRVAVEPICPYPPGVAVVVPGHLVSEDQLAFLELLGALPESLQVLP
jgi:lysine decarboxylase